MKPSTKQALKTIGWVIGFLYCQASVGLTGWIVYYAFTDTGSTAYLITPRLVIAGFMFIVSSLCSACLAAQFMPKGRMRNAKVALVALVLAGIAFWVGFNYGKNHMPPIPVKKLLQVYSNSSNAPHQV